MNGSRRFLGLAITLGVAVSLLGGCKSLLKKAQQDAGTVAEEEPVADAATVTVTGSGAKNEKDILRYAKEEKIADEAATIGKDGGVAVKTFPGNGMEVATLAKGTAVVKIAKYFSTGVLITFDDPAGGGKLMGWVPPEVFASTAVAAATQTATANNVAPTTPKAATVDAGAVTDAGVSKDAGAADAGKTATVDAGASPASPATPGASVLVAQPDGAGKCPTGFALIGPLCRRPCTKDTECPRTTVCLATAGATKKSCQVK